MLEDVFEKVKDVSLAVVLEGHWPCVFYSSTSIDMSFRFSNAGGFDLRVVRLTEPVSYTHLTLPTNSRV